MPRGRNVGSKQEQNDADKMVHPMTKLDEDWLHQWIHPRHLDAGRMQRYRQHFTAQAGPYVVLGDFLRDEVAETVAGFLVAEASYRQSRGLYFAEAECSDEEWAQAEARQRFFSYRVLAEEQWRSEVSSRATAYLALRQAFAERRFADYFSTVTGLPFGDDTEVGTHGMQRGDFLKMHRDLGHNRRLAFLLYLSPGWQEAWGGALHLIDDQGGETPLVPAYNRLVLFDVIANKGHFVTEVTAAAGERSRLSLGGWLHNPPTSAQRTP